MTSFVSTTIVGGMPVFADLDEINTQGIEIEASTENEARLILRNYMPDNGFDFRRESDGGKCWLELNST